MTCTSSPVSRPGFFTIVSAISFRRASSWGIATSRLPHCRHFVTSIPISTTPGIASLSIGSFSRVVFAFSPPHRMHFQLDISDSPVADGGCCFTADGG